jgi:hypothetical protein
MGVSKMKMVNKIRIPKKHTWTVDNLTCPAVTVCGSLTVTGGLVTGRICGNGSVYAKYIRAETITCGELEADNISAKRIRARSVKAGEVILGGGYARQDEPAPETADIEPEPDGDGGTGRSSDAEPDGIVDGSGDGADTENTSLDEASKLLDDPSFLRLRAMHKLERNYGCMWLLKTRPETSSSHRETSPHPETQTQTARIGAASQPERDERERAKLYHRSMAAALAKMRGEDENIA